MTNLATLREVNSIIDQEGFTKAPWKTERAGEWIEVLIGIGNDHTASLTMPKESYDELQRILSEADRFSNRPR